MPDRDTCPWCGSESLGAGYDESTGTVWWECRMCLARGRRFTIESELPEHIEAAQTLAHRAWRNRNKWPDDRRSSEYIPNSTHADRYGCVGVFLTNLETEEQYWDRKDWTIVAGNPDRYPIWAPHRRVPNLPEFETGDPEELPL